MQEMLNQLHEKDFYVLRGSLKSGRQSPKNLAFAVFLSIFIQPLIFFLTYVVAADTTIYPYKDILMNVHLWITIALVVFSIFLSIPKVYSSNQKAQYLLIIFVSQNIGLSMYLNSLFILGSNNFSFEATVGSLMNFTFITLSIGLLVFVITYARFYILLKKGHYKEGTKKDAHRSKLEKGSYLPVAIMVGTALVYIIQYMHQISYTLDINAMVLITIGPLLYFSMLFVLPEQLVILYCKYRFESFNFDKNGNFKDNGIGKGG